MQAYNLTTSIQELGFPESSLLPLPPEIRGCCRARREAQGDDNKYPDLFPNCYTLGGVLGRTVLDETGAEEGLFLGMGRE